MHYCNSSGLLTTTAIAVFTGPCLFHGMTVIGNATAATASLYDSATTSTGTNEIATVSMITTATSFTANTPQLVSPVMCNKGLFLNLTAGNCIVYFSAI